MHVSYVSEIPVEYAKHLDAADTIDSLRATIALYAEIAADALWAANKMNGDDFTEWRTALKSERKGKFMGEEKAEKFGAILMPEVPN